MGEVWFYFRTKKVPHIALVERGYDMSLVGFNKTNAAQSL